MLARIRSAAVLGIDAYLVEVEVDISNGLPSVATVGLPHGAVKEGRERVTAALVNAGYQFPLKRITINLAPADVRKDGSGFDLPIALGILAASEQLSAERLANHLVVGEVGLEGDLRPVRGALSMTLAARKAGLTGVILPVANLPEAAVVEGIEVRGARSLAEVCDHLGPGPDDVFTVDDSDGRITTEVVAGIARDHQVLLTELRQSETNGLEQLFFSLTAAKATPAQEAAA